MKQLLALLLFVPSLCLAQSVTLPYNPDVNADSAITSTDLLGLLPIFGGFFTPEEVLIDGMTINEYLLLVEENGGALPVEGSEHGQMLYWNGEEWVLVSVGENGQFLGLIDNTPVWQDLPTGAGVPEVGCADQTACNYDSGASVNWAPLCVYEDECGVCDGPGAIYECGCADLPEGDCDCDGNQLDALNVCGGTCAADVDGDGICDDGDDCIGEADECGVCNGPGAIYECGCSEPDPVACDCAGNTLDAVGVCGGGCTEDADGDGICDTEDDCVGEYDFCGVCNGPGPILGCGCEDIPDGYCDCNGNVLDAVGTCGGACQNDFNGDGICDDDSIPGCTYEVACNYDPSASINDGSCDFTSCYGCTDPAACNYSPAATFDNGICWYPEASYDCDFNCLIDTDGDGVCDDLEIFGCTLEDACNYEPGATELDDSCLYLDECGECGGTGTLGCTDSTACNFNPEAACDDGSCATDGEVGCLDEEACNFNPDAICSDGNCQYLDECGECGGTGTLGCTNPLADNYDDTAGCDDGSCVVYGCTVDLACNYEPTANIDDNSCEFGTCPGCTDPNDLSYNPTSTNDSLCGTYSQFTNCGAEGPFGPSQLQCDVAYGAGVVTSNGGIQNWTIQVTGLYRISATGAQGAANGSGVGGKGAKVEGLFSLEEGQSLQILVGQEGLSDGCSGGGGGASFVVLSGVSDLEGLLLAASGGGGVRRENDVLGCGGLSTEWGAFSSHTGEQCSSKTSSWGAGGDYGPGWYGAGGGGFFSSGADDAECPNGCFGSGGKSFLEGGQGGLGPGPPDSWSDSPMLAHGGFGGGGSGNGECGGGGGGGFSGGDGGEIAGGGGSYNSGTGQLNEDAANTGHGTVTITLVSISE